MTRSIQRISALLRSTAPWIGLALGAMAWAGSTASAAGLGPITVRSLLGQPLIAEIEVVVSDKRELESLSARVAPLDAHRGANIPYLVTELGLRAAIQTTKAGRSIIRVESLRPVNDPAVKLLIELSGSGARTLRDYPLLLDPPEVRQR